MFEVDFAQQSAVDLRQQWDNFGQSVPSSQGWQAQHPQALFVHVNLFLYQTPEPPANGHGHDMESNLKTKVAQGPKLAMTARRGDAEVSDENFSPGVALVVSLLGLVGIPARGGTAVSFERFRRTMPMRA